MSAISRINQANHYVEKVFLQVLALLNVYRLEVELEPQNASQQQHGATRWRRWEVVEIHRFQPDVVINWAENESKQIEGRVIYWLTRVPCLVSFSLHTYFSFCCTTETIDLSTQFPRLPTNHSTVNSNWFFSIRTSYATTKVCCLITTAPSDLIPTKSFDELTARNSRLRYFTAAEPYWQPYSNRTIFT